MYISCRKWAFAYLFKLGVWSSNHKTDVAPKFSINFQDTVGAK